MHADQIRTILKPYLDPQEREAPSPLFDQLSVYLDLLLRWNARTNLTAIREPEEIVRRHFGESLFTAAHLPAATTLLDFGSGAGFPGLPIQLFHPHLQVTLAESQNKKATFLREVVRTLGLPTEVFAARVESMPPTRTFGIVTLRAVDNMAAARHAAIPRVSPNGHLITLGSESDAEPSATLLPMPNSTQTWLRIEPL
jgi:16S rRNA (guanine527-N7)-methyltransferase